MDQETQKLIDEQFLKLPKNFQEAISSIPWEKTIDETLSSISLTSEQKESAKRETILVIYGFDDPASYLKNLINEAGIPPKDALFIAEKASGNIFETLFNKAQEFEKNKSDDPVIITAETKKAVMQELSQRVEAARQGGASVKPKVLEIAPEIHPMVKKGEVAHEVPHVEIPVPEPKPAITPMPEPVIAEPIPEPTLQNPKPAEPTPQNPMPADKKPPTPANRHYPDGLDPYREPLA